MSEKKKSGGALLGAAFLMATSAIGPGFLTQTATFTGQYQASNPCSHCTDEYLARALCNRTSWTGCFQ